MKITTLWFIQEFLFDDDYKKEVTDYVYAHGHRANLRIKWRSNLQRVPTVLFNNEENDKTIWVLIRNYGDIELRTALSLDPEDETAEFDKMPVGVQRAIAIFFPKGNEPLGWRLFQDTIMESSEQVIGGIKTHTNKNKRFHGKKAYEFYQDMRPTEKAE